MMFREDDLDFKTFDPGVYEAEVKEVEEKKTSKGDPMWSLCFIPVGQDQVLCFDNIIWSKAGKGIAANKCKTLGFPPDVNFEAQELVGKRASLTLVEEEYKGKKNLKPSFDAENFGYASLAPEDIPF